MEIRELLAKKHTCYVLITCDSPQKNGKMNVEMSYDGDPVLVEYLLQGAQAHLDEQNREEDFANN